jgi:hypothetical protein
MLDRFPLIYSRWPLHVRRLRSSNVAWFATRWLSDPLALRLLVVCLCRTLSLSLLRCALNLTLLTASVLKVFRPARIINPRSALLRLPFVTNLELLVPGLLIDPVNPHRSCDVTSEWWCDWINVCHNSRLSQFLFNSRREILLAATPGRMNHCVSQWRQRKRIKHCAHIL